MFCVGQFGIGAKMCLSKKKSALITLMKKLRKSRVNHSTFIYIHYIPHKPLVILSKTCVSSYSVLDLKYTSSAQEQKINKHKKYEQCGEYNYGI